MNKESGPLEAAEHALMVAGFQPRNSSYTGGPDWIRTTDDGDDRVKVYKKSGSFEITLTGGYLQDLPAILFADELREALTRIRETLLKQVDSSYVPTLGDLAFMLDTLDTALAKAQGKAGQGR